MSATNSLVAVLRSHEQAGNAIRELHNNGYDMRNVSIVGRDYHTDEHFVGYYNAGKRKMHWGKLGADLGGYRGLLFGSALFRVPGLGPLVAAGPLVTCVVGALEEGSPEGEFCALGVALASIGIPRNYIVQCETEVKNGMLLLVVHGTCDDLKRAKDLLEQKRATRTTVHAEPLAIAM